jgi:hypothetical protein
VTLLGSLPASYSALVTTLESCVDDVKLDFVQQALLHEERKSLDHQVELCSQIQDRPRRIVRCFGCVVLCKQNQLAGAGTT